jgi:hypothetical protein
MSTSTTKSAEDQPFRYSFVSIDDKCDGSHADSPPCFTLLSQFYDELMISTFPLEDERDDLEDWLECFRFQMKQRRWREQEGVDLQKLELSENDQLLLQGNAMDVILMIADNNNIADGDSVVETMTTAQSGLYKQFSSFGGLYAPHKNKADPRDSISPVIIGGAAVEYYKESRVGLLSYIVLHNDFRGRGLAAHLHKEALSRLERLASLYSTAPPKELDDSNQSVVPPLMQAVFAETNTAAAGDVTPEQSLLRHKSLYKLGYRLVNFPYAQPPLCTDDVDGSFDNLLLLVYFPFSEDEISNSRPSFTMNEATRFYQWFDCNSNTMPVWMNVDTPFCYVKDFYKSVFGYNSAEENLINRDDVEGIPDYRTAKYYQLAHWFSRIRESSGSVDVNLCSPPWEDCKDELYKELAQWQTNGQNT